MFGRDFFGDYKKFLKYSYDLPMVFLRSSKIFSHQENLILQNHDFGRLSHKNEGFLEEIFVVTTKKIKNIPKIFP